MKHQFLIIAIILLTSCSIKENKEQQTDKTTSDSIGIQRDYQNLNESDYLKIRNDYIEHLQGLQKAGKNMDSLSKLDYTALKDLELILKQVLKEPNFLGQGEINLITLLGFIDFGMLDGITLETDSMKIFYTSRNLFLQYFKGSKNFEIDNLSPQDLENIFTSAFICDAHVYNLSDIKLNSSSESQSYGIVGSATNGFGPIMPEYLFVFVAKGNFIYLVKRDIKQFKEIEKCKAKWDSIWQESEKKRESDNASNGFELIDSIMFKYCTFFKKELTNDNQFKSFKKKIEEIATFLEQQK